MLTFAELVELSGQDAARLTRTLARARVAAERLGGSRSAVYDWERLAERLSPTLAARIEQRARIEGFSLRARADTVAGAPHLLAQWNWKRNGALLPWRVAKMSTLRVWWKCPAGRDHEWKQRVHPRNTKKRGDFPGCPFCAGRYVSITNCLATRAPRIAKEWHPTKNGALTPRDIQAHAMRKAWWRCPRHRDHVWQERVGSRTSKHRPSRCPFCQSRRTIPANSLATRAPALARQWHPTRNHPLTPAHVVPGATRLVWWKCPRGADHVWRQSPKARSLGRGCPFCAGKAVSRTNSLATLMPRLAKQWHPSKNGGLLPRDVVVGSARRVWWRCPRDETHVWQTTVNSRTSATRAPAGFRGCPFCSGRRVSRSTSLAAHAPGVAREWHPTLNGALEPRDVSAGMLRKVWWRCARGHIWQARIRNRARNGQGCPHCDRLRRRGAKIIGQSQ